MSKQDLLERFALFKTGNAGLESLVSNETSGIILNRLAELNEEPLSKVQLNQLLGLGEERGVSDSFFRYYWSAEPKSPYKLSVIPGFSTEFPKHDKIQNLDHFFYGLYRIYVDGLLYRGNVRAYYREFASKSYEEIETFIGTSLLDTEAIKRRGPILPLRSISKDHRYLISEMACKSYGETPKTRSELKDALLTSWSEHEKGGGGQITVRDLLTQELGKTKYVDRVSHG